MADSVTPSTYDGLRDRWNAVLTGGTTYNPTDPDIARQINATDTEAQDYRKTLNKTPTRTALWVDLPSMTASGDITGTYYRLKVMTLALVQRGSSLQGNTALKADIISALDWYYTHHYNENTTEFDNWWHWQIGAPLQLDDIVFMLYADLTATQRTNYMAAVNHFTPNASGTGANLVWTATIVAMRGILVQDPAKITAARDALSLSFPYVTLGDGFYADGSFIQHARLPSNGSYGVALLINMSDMLYELNGSPWDITDPNRANVYRWVYDSFEPLIYKGAMMDMTEGRGIARPDRQDHVVGQQVIQAVLRLSQFAPASDAAAYKRMAKYWIQSDTYHSYLAGLPVSDIVLAKQVLNDPTITPRGELLKTVIFGAMDKVVHLRPGFGFGLSMSSNRIFNYESINGENLHGWYTGDGMAYLYNNDLAQYSDDYWATVNPYRLPGTTVSSVTRANSSGQSWLSPATWVGGTQLGNYGGAGMDLRSWNSILIAKKSWFMFDNEIVALGAGITSTGGPTVITTIDNRKISNANTEAVTMDGVVQPTTLGSTKTTTTSKWVNIQSTGGYYFPQGESITLLREARTGNWHDINTNYSNLPNVTRNYVSMVVNHGANPAGGTYSYIVLPNQTAAQTQAYAQNPPTSIIANTPTVQAAHETTQGVLGANFWRAGSASYLTSYTPAAVMVKENDSQYTVAASDPTQSQSQLTIELDKTATFVVSKDPSVTVLSLAPAIKFKVNVAGAKGKSQTVIFGGVSATSASLPEGRPASASTSASGLDPTKAVRACLTWMGGDLHGVVRSWGNDWTGSWCPTGCGGSSSR